VLSALESGLRDFEDAIQTASAIKSGIDTIITRNLKDFIPSDLAVYTPIDFIKQHSIKE